MSERNQRVPKSAGYLSHVLEMASTQRPGTVAIAIVVHDEQCRRPQGGRCTCTPTISREAGNAAN